MTDETKEERDVREAREAVWDGVREWHDGYGVAQYSTWVTPRLVALESAIEARTLAKLRAGVVPLTMTAERERMVRGVVGGRVEWDEIDATRAALAEARERAEAVGLRAREAAQTLVVAVGADGPANVEHVAARAVARIRELEAERDDSVRAYLIGIDEDYGPGPVTPVDVVRRIVAERDDARAKLAALVEAAERLEVLDVDLHTEECRWHADRKHGAPGCDCGTSEFYRCLEAARGA